MDFAIPAQLLEVGNVHVKPFQKKGNYPPLALIQYLSNAATLRHFTLLTPPLMVEDWNPTTGRLRFNCERHYQFKTKFLALQEYLISTIFVNQSVLLGRRDLTHDTIRICFKTLFDRNILSCFISLNHMFPLYVAGERVPVDQFGQQIKAGREMRLLLQITGITYLPGTPYSFRIQHQLVGAYAL
jgi:hypothetical protein